MDSLEARFRPPSLTRESETQDDPRRNSLTREERALIAKSLRSGGGIAQAWREMREKGTDKWSAFAALHRHTGKQIVRAAASAKTPHGKDQSAARSPPWPACRKTDGAYINRDPSTFCRAIGSRRTIVRCQTTTTPRTTKEFRSFAASSWPCAIAGRPSFWVTC